MMLRAPLFALALGALGALGACGSTLPDDVAGYDTRCVRLNETPLRAYEGDPHKGNKNVYACNVSIDALRANTRPFPDGTLIIKESKREGETFNWLTATARKQGGSWKWNEYTRNFGDEDFRHIVSGQSVCTGCHVKVMAVDWIYTSYSRP